MPDRQWGAITPAEVSELMSFERDDVEWHYDPANNRSMAAKQAEGSAYLWNTLALHNVAILADEVGMGKTFQAIAVACLLWKMKPDARILVMAPNRDICAHWRGEYHTFVHGHYKKTDHLVRNAADGGPIHESRLCNRLPELVEDLKKGGCSFYFTTIHSLSGLLPRDQKSGDKAQRAKVIAGNLHKEIKEVLGEKGFDLLIIDEAHYFRNVKGGSQRASAAQAFFGETDKLARKTLLMTATPSHSGMQDVASILSYFVNGILNQATDTKALLERYALRRLRQMKGKDDFHTKHDYRYEVAIEANFENNPGAELFFALYQKKLVTEVEQATNGKRFLYGFLEGFESVGADQSTLQEQAVEFDEAAETDNVKTAFRTAPDTEILKQLTGQYYRKFAKFPEHPKYSKLVKEMLPEGLFQGRRDLQEDKHLIFVRRIPSVRELTQRVNRAYDDLFIERILKAWGVALNSPEAKSWKKKKWSREGFNQLVESFSADTGTDDIDESPDDMDVDDTEDSNIGSLVSNLFVVKKGKGGSTDCSNVRLRFTKPESLFALFLEPASDYKTRGYTYYYPAATRDVRENYLSAAKDQRLSAFDQLTRRVEHSEYDNRSKRQFDRELPTAWSLIFDYLNAEQQAMIEKWSEEPGILENFATYVRTGFLYASPVMIELYCWFTEANLKYSLAKMKSVQKRYQTFLRYVKPKLPSSLLFTYFINALESFEALCTKIKRQELYDWQSDWRQLVNLQHPALYASGEVQNRQRLILGFNSPFYPNVLTATSVFQEGVNLHLQCRKVHHYGLAGSPGDNEQRVGRIDRLFGLVNNDLVNKGASQLSISYPYLTNSFDEDQLASFIMRKHDVEQKMDRCQPVESDSSIDFQSSTLEWRRFLRKPDHSMKDEEDPYPFKESRKPVGFYQERAIHVDDNLDEYIEFLCQKAVEATKGEVFAADSGLGRHVLYLLDNKVAPVSGIPKHPVQVEKHFSSEFSELVSGTVYYLTLKAPLVSLDDVKRGDNQLVEKAFNFTSKHHRRYPLVQLALDDQAVKSHCYLHMKVDLPLFVLSEKYSMLSSQEFSQAYEQLCCFTDLLKGNLLVESSEDDEERVDISLVSESKWQLENDSVSNVAGFASHSNGWTIRESTCGSVVTRNCDIPWEEFAARHRLGSGRVAPVKLLMLNHQYPFLSFHLNGEYCRVGLNYPAVDFQRDEQALLDKWFEYFR